MRVFYVLCFVFLFSLASHSKLNVNFLSVTTVTPKALTIDGKFGTCINGRTYQKDALATHNGYQYIVFYDDERRVCISRKLLPAGEWKTIQFPDYYFATNDSHNIVSLGICPNDGTIHLAFDHHASTLHYRVSVKGLATNPEKYEWSIASFGPIQDKLDKEKLIRITYPKFWPTPDGNLQLCYRVGGSGNGDRVLVDYNAKTGKWEKSRQIDSALGLFNDQLGPSETRCSYPNGYDYDAKGRLHVTWVWREDSQGANHDLSYMYSDDKGFTWKNNAGEMLNEIANVNTNGLVVKSIPRVFGLMNDHGQVIDSKGRVHAVMFHATKETIEAAGEKLGDSRWGPSVAQRYFHYWRDNKGTWSSLELPMAVGNRPKILVDKKDNLIMIYAGTANKNVKGKSNKDNDLIVAVASAKSKWTDWKIVYTYKGPFMNDMLADVYRWKNEGVLSIMLQNEPDAKKEPSLLRVIDLKIK